MIKNYISINITYLVHESRLRQDDFGALFNLNKGLIGNYVNSKALPRIETIQNICLHFEITIDDFINTDLSATKLFGIKEGKLLYANEPPKNDPNIICPLYVKSLEKLVIDKEKIITLLEDKLHNDEKSKTI
jgi:transcriptional regulator with XRE-family HTH domain